ncbi:MAG TPA: hypothetical protein VGB15_23720 [Longimicrobium sp.]|jgi:hypothetical protein
MRFARLLVRLLPLAAALTLPGVAAGDAAAQRRVVFRGDVPRYERNVPAPPEHVVQAVKVVFEELGVPLVQSAQNPNELFTTSQLVRNRQLFGRQIGDFFACNESFRGGNLADHGRVTYAVLIRIIPTNQGVTRMEMQVDGKVVRTMIMNRDQPLDCSSSGLMEKSITDAVEQLVRETAPPPE